MFCFKYFAYLFLVSLTVWAAVRAEDSHEHFNSEALAVSAPLSSEEAAKVRKVNWKPICQQVQVNEVETNSEYPESNVAYLPQELPAVVLNPMRDTNAGGYDTCEAPNGRGLKNLLKESKALLPYDKLKGILSCAAKDPGLQKVVKIFYSESIRLRYVRSILAMENLKDPAQSPSNCNGNGTLIGLLEDLKEALPRQELRDLYARLLASDEYLVAAVKNLKSSEFRQLLHNLSQAPETKELKDILVSLGVPLKSLKDLIDAALGWHFDEFADEETGLKI